MKTKKQSVQTLPTGTYKSRRTFIKNSAALAAVTAVSPLIDFLPESKAEQSVASMMNGIQVGAVSFVDEGVENVLDILQKRGEINTIFLTTFTYGRGLSGRQIPGQPFPDHGSRVSDEKTFYGGNYATPHPGFYRNTVLKETRA
ncbi:MAG: twin-arginine translocation signal domain-containing protein, partial [Bacteroidales bacterium]|nr:twin-arginine translocation signal domain-containing protein [Bacteroidales bacterium]